MENSTNAHSTTHRPLAMQPSARATPELKWHPLLPPAARLSRLAPSQVPSLPNLEARAIRPHAVARSEANETCLMSPFPIPSITAVQMRNVRSSPRARDLHSANGARLTKPSEQRRRKTRRRTPILLHLQVHPPTMTSHQLAPRLCHGEHSYAT